MKKALYRIYRMYADGFRSMDRTAKQLWIIVLIKLFILFAILKLFFFRSDLGKYGSDEKKSEIVIERLTDTKNR